MQRKAIRATVGGIDIDIPIGTLVANGALVYDGTQITTVGGPLVALYFPTNVALTGSLVQQFAFATDAGFAYVFDAELFLNVAVSGTCTVVVGVNAGTVESRLQTVASSGAIPSVSTSVATGNASVTPASFGTTGSNSIIAHGSVKSTAAGNLFLNMSTAGTVTLLAGSSFRVSRAA